MPGSPSRPHVMQLFLACSKSRLVDGPIHWVKLRWRRSDRKQASVRVRSSQSSTRGNPERTSEGASMMVNPVLEHTDADEMHEIRQDGALKLIFSEPLEVLRDTTLDLTSYASEERYRFIDCEALMNDHVLQIYETTILPSGPDRHYSAVSYVWFGLQASSEALHEDGSFRVYCGTRSDGTVREDGGPISMKVLELACRYSIWSVAPFLWLDRLCILQTSKRDKLWQISRMYDVYEGCQECIVLPGGLQRLASVFDETSWADRAWTYQEVIVTWDYAVVLTKDWHDRPKGEQHWLVEGKCHWQYLHELFLEGSELLSSQMSVDALRNTDGNSSLPKPRLIFGRNGAALDILRRIVEYKAYNHLCEEGEETISEHSIRQLVLQGVQMRVSSRPVDMVFSILGLVDVQETLGPRLGEFEENDRFYAMLAVVETMFRQDQGSDDSDAADTSTLVDVPLWASLEPADMSLRGKDPFGTAPHGLNPADLPNLRELAEMFTQFDGMLVGVPRAVSAPNGKLTLVPLPSWRYDVAQTVDDAEEQAAAIGRSIPETDLMNAYHGEQVVVQHESEGCIQLCRHLDVKRTLTDKEQWAALSELFVFGWSLKLQSHPYIRFYKLGISRLFN